MLSARARPVSPSLLATLFHGLADPARLSCLLALRDRSHTVSELVALTGLSQPNASKHLACLRDCGLVRSERHGRFVSYALSEPDVARLLKSAEDLLALVGPTVAACPATDWSEGRMMRATDGHDHDDGHAENGVHLHT